MISVERMRRLGGVSLIALSTLAAIALVDPLAGSANAQNTEVQPPFAAAIPNGAPMSFADLIESVSPAVVTIQAQGNAATPGAGPDMEGVPPQFPPSQPMVLFVRVGVTVGRRGVLLSERPELCPTGRVVDLGTPRPSRPRARRAHEGFAVESER